jgi:hypothetical protein
VTEKYDPMALGALAARIESLPGPDPYVAPEDPEAHLAGRQRMHGGLPLTVRGTTLTRWLLEGRRTREPSEARTCACGCGRSLDGRRASALYFNGACRVRASRGRDVTLARPPTGLSSDGGTEE